MPPCIWYIAPVNKKKNTAMNIAIKRDLFDFEIGYLTRSPCLNCARKKDLPGCHDDCNILDMIQTTLARGISCQSSKYES